MGKIIFTKSRRFRNKPHVKFCIQDSDTTIAVFNKGNENNCQQAQYCNLKKCRGVHLGCARCAKNRRHAGQCAPLTGFKTYTKKQKMEKLQSIIDKVKLGHDMETIKKIREEGKNSLLYTQLLKSDHIDVTHGIGGKQEMGFTDQSSPNVLNGNSCNNISSSTDFELICLERDRFCDWYKPSITESPTTSPTNNIKGDLNSESATSSTSVYPFKSGVKSPCFFDIVAQDILKNKEKLWDEFIGLTRPLSPIIPSVYEC